MKIDSFREIFPIQSVDVYDKIEIKTNKNGSSTKIDRNQPFYDFSLNQWVQGNTINSSFNMGYYTDWQKDGGYENNVLVLNNTKTLSGIAVEK